MANKGLAKDQKDLSILVTGGAGFIGSHTCVELIQRGYSVVIVDDLSNSSQIAVDRIRKICGIDADDAQLRFYRQNILDREALDAIFAENDVDAIIHFAGFKAVGESVQKPLEYYWNNIAGTLVLCDVARNHGVKNIVFSSSATVYGEPEFIPITEECPKHDCTNPYGWTKSMLEQVLTDLYVGEMCIRDSSPPARRWWEPLRPGPRALPRPPRPHRMRRNPPRGRRRPAGRRFPASRRTLRPEWESGCPDPALRAQARACSASSWRLLPFLIVDDLVVGLDGAIIGLSARCSTGRLIGALLAVCDLGQLVASLLQLLGGSLDGLDIGAGQSRLRLVDGCLLYTSLAQALSCLAQD